MELKEAVKRIRPFIIPYLESQGIDTTKNFRCLNPDHEDSHPSCGVYHDRVRCFSCGFVADLMDCAVILEGLPSSGTEWIENNLKVLASRFKIDLELEAPSIETLELLRCRNLYRDITKALILPEEHILLNDELEKRQWLRPELVKQHIGLIKNYDKFIIELQNKKYDDEFLIRAGILGSQSIFQNQNLIFTWHDKAGVPVGFTARSIKKDTPKNQRFLNLKYRGLVAKVFNKKSRLYNLHGLLETKETKAFLFEGQSDVITAKHNGLNNCVACGGASFTLDHLLTLKDHGINEVIFVFDNDLPGNKKLIKIIEDVLPEVRDLRCKILVLPKDKDPDEFLRENTLEAFNQLPIYSIFKWKLLSFDEEMDPSDKCSEAIKLIASEPSPLEREKQVKDLSQFTGVPLRTIRDELSYLVDSQGHERLQERQRVIERVLFDVKKRPEEAEIALQTALSRLTEVSKKHYGDAFSESSFLRMIDNQKENEEHKSGKYEGFKLGKDLAMFEEVLCGDWTKGVWLAFGGIPNSGKSSILCKFAYEIATRNENITVIYHTIDDSANQILPRFVCIAESSLQLEINHVRNPHFWLDRGYTQVFSKRDFGYQKIRDLASEAKLVIKDQTQGFSLQFAESLITYYQEKYPERQIVYVLDNFHKLQDFAGLDERVRFKHLSTHIKDIAVRRQVPILSSVEYTKTSPGQKPTNNNVAESAQIIYDCNLLVHIYNEVSDLPSSFSVCHGDIDSLEMYKLDPYEPMPLSALEELANHKNQAKGWNSLLPRIEVIIGKNKISDQKNTFFLDFYPASSDFRACSQSQVLKDRIKLQGIRKKMKNNDKDDMFNASSFGINKKEKEEA